LLISRRCLETSKARSSKGRWLDLGIYADDREARIEPFETAVLDVASWWP
jgi:hypothetical protein